MEDERASAEVRSDQRKSMGYNDVEKNPGGL